jgi:tripartite-type tricarboxylate transporter receptor subunit TctC
MMRMRDAGVLLLLAAGHAAAQEYPVKPVRVLVGGGSDVIIRVLGDRLTELWRQPVIVDNRAGAGGSLAVEVVAKAAPDGYTLLLAAPTFAINAALKLGNYDYARDFAPIVQSVGHTPFVLVIHPSLPVRSVNELIELAKARPGQLNYGSPQPGGPTHLSGDLFKMMAHVDMVHVPYKGVGPAVLAVMTGEVQLMFAVAPSVMPHIGTGRLRAIAVTTAAESPLVPGVPSVAESGLKGYETSGWNGFLGPAGAPPAVIAKVNADVLSVMKRADVRERLLGAGYLTSPDNSPAQFGEFVRREFQKWSMLAKESKTTVK